MRYLPVNISWQQVNGNNNFSKFISVRLTHAAKLMLMFVMSLLVERATQCQIVTSAFHISLRHIRLIDA